MSLHQSAHPLAGQTVTLAPVAPDGPLVLGVEYRIEDYWDRVSGQSWMNATGNPAALGYAMRTGLAKTTTPIDDEVLYGKIGGLGYLVHASEIVS